MSCSYDAVIPQSMLKTLESHDADAFAFLLTVRSAVQCEVLSIRAEEVNRCHEHHSVGCKDRASTRGGLIDKTVADSRSRVSFLLWGLGVA